MPTLSPSNCINVEHQGVEGGKFLRRRERLTRSGLVRSGVSTERSGDASGSGGVEDLGRYVVVSPSEFDMPRRPRSPSGIYPELPLTHGALSAP